MLNEERNFLAAKAIAIHPYPIEGIDDKKIPLAPTLVTMTICVEEIPLHGINILIIYSSNVYVQYYKASSSLGSP